MYSLKNGAEFGYVGNDPELLKKKYKYKLFNNMYMGRACQSGMASVDTVKKTMKCVEISHIKTNLDNFAKPQKTPYYCGLPQDDGSSESDCKYYYKDEAGNEQLIESEYCECSLMMEAPTKSSSDRRELREGIEGGAEGEELEVIMGELKGTDEFKKVK